MARKQISQSGKVNRILVAMTDETVEDLELIVESIGKHADGTTANRSSVIRELAHDKAKRLRRAAKDPG